MQENSKLPPEISYQAELLRKSLHLLALIIPLGIWYLGKHTALMILLPSCALALFLEVTRVRYEFIARWVEVVFGKMMRPSERPAIGEPVVINGATWVLLTSTLLTIVFPATIAAASMVMFMLGDAAAALVGRRFGRIHWLGSPKTVEGSVAFLLVAFLGVMFFEIVPPWPAFGIAAFATLLELLPIPGNDNLYAPLGTAILMFLILRFYYLQEMLLFF